MISNNQYLKRIWIKLTDPNQSEQNKTHTDYYYLKQICISLGNSYTETVSENKLIKDFAEAVTGDSYSEHHYDNYYYRRIALEYVESLEHTNTNYLLKVISENIAGQEEPIEPVLPTVTSVTVDYSPSTIYVGDSVTLTATVLDDNNSPLNEQTVEFFDGQNTLGTAITNNSGVATTSINNLTVGSHTITTTCSNITSSSITITVNKITPTISLIAGSGSGSVTYGNSFNLNGVLSIGSGETVTLYKGNELLSTCTTTSNGEFSHTVSGLSAGTYNFTAVYSGDTNHNSVTSTNVQVVVNKAEPILEMTVPDGLVYGDSFTVTGTLKNGSVPIDGESVCLKIDDAIVDTGTTVSGVVSFNVLSLSVGTHTFQLSYNGGDNFIGTTSIPTETTVAKETVLLEVSNPSTNSTTIGIRGNLTISGTLTDDDSPNANPIANASILVKEDNTTLTTLTTGNDGSFSGTISGATLGVGTHSLEIRYVETTNYSTSYATKEVIVEAGTLSFSANPSTLSYVDNDTSTLTATLTSAGTGISGETVYFTIEGVNDTLTSDTNCITGNPTYSNDGALVSDYGSYYSNYLFDLENKSYQISFTAKKVTGEDTYFATHISNTNASDFGTAMTMGEFNEFFGTSFTQPSGLTDSVEVLADITPTVQKLYINEELVCTSDYDMADPYTVDGANYFGFMGEFYIKDLVVCEVLGSDVTDSNGVATCSYVSTGVGDVTVQASVGTSLLQTYNIKDMNYANIGITNKLSDFNTSGQIVIGAGNKTKGTISITHNSPYYEYSLSGAGNFSIFPITPLSSISGDFEVWITGNYLGLSILDGSHLIGLYNRGCANTYTNQHTWDYNTITSSTPSEWISYMKKESNKITCKIFDLNGTELGSKQWNVSFGTCSIGLFGGNTTSSFKDLMFKRL